MAESPCDAELVIGIVARIGVDITTVVKHLNAILDAYGYETTEIRVTAAIKELAEFKVLPLKPADKRYATYITACNTVRKRTGLKDAMARFAISRISLERQKSSDAGQNRPRAFIINQLKRTEETDLLRSVYGEHYIQISCHAHEDNRLKGLSTIIADDHPEKPKASQWKSVAQDLIQTDEAEEDDENGQRVRDVFPLSDVVIDASGSRVAEDHLERFIRAVFGDHSVTPTREEYGMHLASTASLRSSDLSRQVGAAIINKYSEIQALGCNEVARAGGGTYWEGDEGDDRDFRRGKDSNEERKREVLIDLAIRMQRAGIISSDYTAEGLSDKLLKREDNLIKNAQIMDSLEYGRTVHAEMNARTDAARGGHSIRDCTLYSNTFPCHNCAKHIVASGIDEVIYLRPYPKSYAEDLFFDSIEIDAMGRESGKVLFRQFIGIVGPLYSRVFSKRRWKNDDGSVLLFVKAAATFNQRTPLPLTAYTGKEATITTKLGEALQRCGLIPIHPRLAPQPAALKLRQRRHVRRRPTTRPKA